MPLIIDYYIKCPAGRFKLDDPRPTSDESAICAFKEHWTATADWATKTTPKRTLVKEVKEEILVD